jgi:FtsH-binding integral membrane protein
MRRDAPEDYSYSHPSYDARKDVNVNRDWRRPTYSSSYSGELSPSAYNALIGVILLYGFGLNVILVKNCVETFASMNPIALIILYFVISISGMIISKKSDNPLVSFIGYNMVVVPVGIVLSVALKGESDALIFNALAVTTGVVALMLVAGTLFPGVFLSMGRALGMTLIIVIIVELVLMLLNITRPTFLDVIVALLFCCYIGYDWAKAQQDDKTADNAVDACVGLYLDIINLFLRILSLSSRSRKD